MFTAAGSFLRARPAALAALLLAVVIQLSPLLFLGRPIGVADGLMLYPPWASRGARPPSNPLLEDASTGLVPWMTSWRAHPGEVLAVPGVACGALGPAAGVIGLLSPAVVLPFFALSLDLSLTGMVLIDLVLGFCAFYAWRRGRGDSDLEAALGASVWAWAPARAVLRTWPFAGTTVLFPLLLMAVDACTDPPAADAPRRRFGRRALFGAALAAGLVLGGHPSFGMMGIWLAAAYATARIVGLRNARTVAALLKRAAPFALGGAFALVALVPVLALGASFLREGEWARLRQPLAQLPPVPWRVLFLLFDPAFYGDPVAGTWRSLGWKGPDNFVELQLYMGLVPLLLAPLGLASRRREAKFFALVGLAALLAFVAGGPFAAAARLLPGIRLIALSRLRLVALCSAAVLTALGARTLRRTRVGALRLVLPAIFLFTVLDLSLADLRFGPLGDPSRAPDTTPALETLKRLAPGDGRRFFGLGMSLPPNVSMALGLEDVRAHMTFTAGYARFLSRLDASVYGRRGTFLAFLPDTLHPDARLLDLLGVSALIAPPGTRGPGGDFQRVHEGDDADVWSRPWKAPARLAAKEGDGEAGRVISFDARRGLWHVVTVSNVPATLQLGRSRLVPVDRIRVDGTAALPRADPRIEGLLAVDIPAGRHDVVVDAALPPVLIAVSAAGLVGLTFLTIFCLHGPRAPARLSA